MSLRIGILSTRGIPNNYGGFEQLAEYLSVGLFERGHEVTVYNSHSHPCKEKKWRGVSLVHCYDPEDKLGSSGQFIYDFNCIMDARKRNFDVLLILGYTSISVCGAFFPKNAVTIFNMDGFEWKRAKYSSAVKKFLLYAEKLAIKFGDYFISDSPLIKTYFQNKYNIKSEHIAYGAETRNDENENALQFYRTEKFKYYLTVARIEPENNIEMILDGFASSSSEKKMIVVGNVANKFGKYLTRKFSADERICFSGSIYDKQIKHSLCHYCKKYFHGHSTGGTNPSLLEAMASRAVIAAHENDFNKEVLGENAFYFSNSNDIKEIIESGISENNKQMIRNNLIKVQKQYKWDDIINQYENFIFYCYNQKKIEKNIYYQRYSYK